jgi:hypothetical protein
MKFNFKRCNDTNNDGIKRNYCKSKEVIEEKLGTGGYFSMYMVDTSVTPTNYSSPINFYGRNIFTSYSSRAFRTFNLYMKTIQVVDDIGWLMDDVHTRNYPTVDYTFETWDYRDTSNVIYTMSLRCSTRRTVYNRYYLKIQEIAADVGGIIETLLIIGKFCVYYFANAQFKEYVVNYFFDDEDLEKEKGEKVFIKRDGLNLDGNSVIKYSLKVNSR